jgi:hypothetical protein
MAGEPLTLDLLAGRFAVCRLGPDEAIPPPVVASGWFSVTRTADELSLVCAEELAPPGRPCETGWRCLAVRGPLAFDQVGVLASLASPLAAAGVSLLAIATHDTDYRRVREADLDRALAALAGAGHRVPAPRGR